MKKVVLVLTVALGSLIGKAQTVYTIDGMKTGFIKIKMNTVLTITDSILTVHSEHKGKISDYTLRIVSKDEKPNSSTYNCIGQIGSADKHQIIITNWSIMHNVLWTSINSFANTRTEILYSLKK